MTLMLGTKRFNLKLKGRNSSFMIWENEDKGIKYCVECGFERDEESGWAPSLCINSIETNYKSIEELLNKPYKVTSIEEANEREDSFYIYEHEPLVNYELIVLKQEGDYMHIKCSGVAIIDGYADPYISESFEIDCRLPIIKTFDD